MTAQILIKILLTNIVLCVLCFAIISEAINFKKIIIERIGYLFLYFNVSFMIIILFVLIWTQKIQGV